MDGPRPVVRSVATEVAPPSWAWSEPLPYTRYAGFWRRFVAAWIDGFLIGIVLRILDSIMGRVVEQNQFDPLVSLMWFAIWFVSFITIDWLYYALQESSEYRATLGKRALGIVVTDLSGNRISFGRATGR